MHCVVALAIPDVVAFDLAIPAQIFGHRVERDRYAFSVCSVHPGPVPSSTGFSVTAVNLRTHLMRRSGRTPSEYRRTFRSAAGKRSTELWVLP